MIAYVGQTRSRAFIATLNAAGIGECAVPSELPPKRRPWFFDNGAFRDWRHGRPFDVEGFGRGVEAIKADRLAPDFVVLPDKVAAGLESLRFSRDYVEQLRGVAPLYLAVQDGMGPQDVVGALDGVDGIFVGGTLEWKLGTGGAWVAFAHAQGRPCHVGRVGIPRRVAWAQAIGADSIDSCQPLWSVENLRAWVEAVTSKRARLSPIGGSQGGLFMDSR